MSLDRRYIESILKINGVPESSPDEEIRSVLVSARFDKNEVDAALMVLRENTVTNETRVEGLHKVFRTDQALKSSEISQLLGINVDIEHTIAQRRQAQGVSMLQYVILWVASVVLASTFLLSYMYANKVGVFHPSENFNASFS